MDAIILRFPWEFEGRVPAAGIPHAGGWGGERGAMSFEPLPVRSTIFLPFSLTSAYARFAVSRRRGVAPLVHIAAFPAKFFCSYNSYLQFGLLSAVFRVISRSGLYQDAIRRGSGRGQDGIRMRSGTSFAAGLCTTAARHEPHGTRSLGRTAPLCPKTTRCCIASKAISTSCCVFFAKWRCPIRIAEEIIGRHRNLIGTGRFWCVSRPCAAPPRGGAAGGAWTNS